MQGILLAAGFGRRFNEGAGVGQDKLLTHLPSSNQLVLWHSAYTLITVIPNSIAVIQPQRIARKKILEDLGFKVIESVRAKDGVGYALADAVIASQHANGWLIALADMPWVTAELVKRLSEAVVLTEDVAAPRFNNRRGQPTAFGAAWSKRLASLQGDVGAREFLKKADIHWIDWHDDSIHQDVDKESDLLD